MLGRLPALLRFLLMLAAINFAVFAAMRGVFWTVFRETLAGASATDLLKAFTLGLRFDLRLALLLGLPPALLGWIPFFHPMRRGARRAWIGYFAVAQAIVLLLYFVDFGHYAYVRVRLNATLIDHLTPVGVAARVAWETYPVLLCLVGLALLIGAYSWLANRAARGISEPPPTPPGRWTKVATVAAFAALYVLGIHGK